MNSVRAKYERGQIALTEPVDWPDGLDLIVEPVSQTGSAMSRWPGSVSELLTRMAQVEPPLMSPQEKAEWQIVREIQKEFEKAIFLHHGEKLRRMWE